jgi:hypothetical protein
MDFVSRLIPPWVRFWWRHLKWLPFVMVTGALAIEAFQGSGVWFLRTVVGTPSSVLYADKLEALPSWLVTSAIVLTAAAIWMRNVHADYAALEEDRDWLRLRLLSPKQKLIAAKEVLRRQISLGYLLTDVAEQGEVTIETDEPELAQEALTRLARNWISDTAHAVRQILGQYAALELAKLLPEDVDATPLHESFRRITGFLRSRLETLGESDISLSFDPSERLVTEDKHTLEPRP